MMKHKLVVQIDFANWVGLSANSIGSANKSNKYGLSITRCQTKTRIRIPKMLFDTKVRTVLRTDAFFPPIRSQTTGEKCFKNKHNKKQFSSI